VRGQAQWQHRGGEDLIAREGYYSNLYNKQLLEEELAEVS